MSWKKFLKIAVAVVAVVATGPLGAAIGGALVSSGIMAAGLAASVVSGAIAGAIVGGVGAAVTGGDWKKGMLLGAAGGAISGGLTDYTAGLNAGADIGNAPGALGEGIPQPAGSGATPQLGAPPQAAPDLIGGPGDGLAGGANPQTVPSGPQAPGPYGEGIPQATTATPPGASTQTPPPVTKPPGMLDGALSKITEITKAHPWTQDLAKGAGEALFKGIAAQNTPTEAEQTMDLLKFREEMNSKSVMGLGADPFGRRVAAPNSQAQQIKKPFVPFGQGGMLKFPTGG